MWDSDMDQGDHSEKEGRSRKSESLVEKDAVDFNLARPKSFNPSKEQKDICRS